jgi:polyisoprenoid-binding protein YceI
LVRRDAFLLRLSLAAGAAALSLWSVASAQELAIAPGAARAEFSVSHLFVSRAHGSIPVVAASIALDQASGLPRSVEATLDPRRIDTGNASRDRDLARSYWFDSERFPAIRFSGGPATGTSAAFDLPGRLTIKGVTLAVTLHVTASALDATHRRYHAVASVSRHAFGLYAKSADGLVGDGVSLDITLDVANP